MGRIIVPVIMSGGSGTRLWPLSTDARPKQFHALRTHGTMIQETALRLSGDAGGVQFAPPVVIGNIMQADLICEQLAAVGVTPAEVILEPVGRNTAATAALAALCVRVHVPDALVLLAPADHVISDPAAFRNAVARASAFAAQRIVTFGIIPDRPETGYGYIEAGAALGDGVMAISSFKEKPDAATAADYVARGGFYWNAGIFLYGPDVMVSELGHATAIRDGAAHCYADADCATLSSGTRIVRLPASFADVPSQPVDIAVMEKTTLGAVAPCDIGWADVGSWSELWRLGAQGSPEANVTEGQVVHFDCAGSLLKAHGIIIAAAGLQDMIVVATRDAVLIVPKDRAQDVKKLWEATRKRAG